MGLAPRPQGSPALCCRRSPQMCDQSLGVDDSNARERGLVERGHDETRHVGHDLPTVVTEPARLVAGRSGAQSSYRQGVLCRVRVRELADAMPAAMARRSGSAVSVVPSCCMMT